MSFSYVEFLGLTFGFGEMSIANVIKSSSGTEEVLDTYWWMSGISQCRVHYVP